jgi:predicted extracellular nuclease
MKRKAIHAVGWLLLALVTCFCSPNMAGRPGSGDYTVIFYNVENLYDIDDDPAVNDNEFLPGSRKSWTSDRYVKKLDDIVSVLAAAGGSSMPALIGLSEVENRKVVEELSLTGNLKKGNYRIVHEDSPDGRGIDVALMYRKDFFNVIGHKAVPVILPERSRATTRDILYVWGTAPGGEELHLFVNHWPSRTGGVQQTERDRIAAARVLKAKADSLFSLNPKVNIIIMGDLNDTPSDKSLQEVLGAAHPGKDGAKLVNLMYPAHLRGEGSYYYRGSYDMLDNMIVSSGLMETEGLSVRNGEGSVFIRDFMNFTNPQGHTVPNRTYVGDRYTGGISDHYPVYFVLTYIPNNQ